MPSVAPAPAPAPREESLHMRRLRGGDAHAIECLYRDYHPRLLSFCRHMLGSPEEAEDVVQLTFLAAHVQLPHERIDTSVGAWLFTVARRKCIDVLRRRRADVPLGDDTVSTAGLTAEVEQRDDLRRLVADLQRLDPTHRAALVLTQLEALSQAQVATVLGTHEARVRRLVFEARQSLLDRRASRDLACRAVQEELANARGSQFRRRHLVAHCEECEECEQYRAALLSQRTALRAVLPAVPLVLPAKKAWASSSVPRPTTSFGRRVLEAVATVPAPALTTLATVVALASLGGLPSAPPPVVERDAQTFRERSRSAPPQPVARPGPPRRTPARGPARRRPGAVAGPTTGPPQPSPALATTAREPGRSATQPAPEPVRPPPPTPTVTTGTTVTLPPPPTVPAVTTPVITTPAVTLPEPVPEPTPCTGDNNGNGQGEGCTPNPDPNDDNEAPPEKPCGERGRPPCER